MLFGSGEFLDLPCRAAWEEMMMLDCGLVYCHGAMASSNNHFTVNYWSVVLYVKEVPITM